MLNGRCPKCNSTTVFAKRNGVQVGDNSRGMFVFTSAITSTTQFDACVCSTCGFLELYVADANKLAEVTRAWTPIKPRT